MIHLPKDDHSCGWYQALPEAAPVTRLKGVQQADYAVLGAGFAGLAAARRLAEHHPNARIVLVDAQRAAEGASGRNSGFVIDLPHKFALERFASDLLTVCDSLEMALGTGDEATVDSLKEGSEATLKLLGSVLARFGIEEVNPEGEPFDPELHEAMTMQPSDDVEPGSVVTVFQKGFTLNGRLLRPARVVVAAEPAGTAKKG